MQSFRMETIKKSVIEVHKHRKKEESKMMKKPKSNPLFAGRKRIV